MSQPRPIVRIATALLAWALVGSLPASGQFHDLSEQESVYLEAGASSKRRPAAARLSFTLLEEIPLPGPLQSPGPRLNGERLEVRVADGWLFTPWPTGPEPEVRRGDGPAAGAEAESPWSVGPAGKVRVRAQTDNRILAEKRCRGCRRGWRRIWKLRVGGQTVAPPLVTERRVFFGALDNRVYSVKKKNGHRVWAADVGGRVSSALVLWSAKPTGEDDPQPGAPGPAAILVVPDRRNRILALDPLSGTELASFSLPDPESRLVGVPVKTPDGSIVAATQKYAPTDASLVVLRLEPVVPAPDETPPVLYNEASADPASAPAR